MKRILVDSMTFPQLADVAQEDSTAVQYFLMENRGKYEKRIREKRPREALYFKPVEFVGSRGYTYSVVYYCHSYADFSRGGICYILYATFQYRGSTWLMFATRRNSTLRTTGGYRYEYNYFCPHVFARYAERELHDKYAIMTDAKSVYADFFKNNAILNTREYTTEDKNTGFFAATMRGYLMGHAEDGIRVYDTYIDADGLTDAAKQGQRAGALNKLVEAYALDDLTPRGR